jgi:acyl carrier protein
MGSSLANQLTQLGEYCIMVSVGSHYQKLTPESYTVNPLVTDDFTKLFQESLENKPPLKGIVHLWSCESNSSTDLSLEALQQAQVISCGGVLSLVQALLQKQGSKLPRLWLVTQDTQSLDSSAKSLEIQHAPLWGLGRAIALEHPELQCVCVDLEASPNPNQSLLLAEILVPDSENQVIYRQEIRHVSRLVQHSTKTQSPILSEWQEADSNDRILILLTHIQSVVAKSLGIDAEQIKLEQPLKTMGFDSLMAVEMRTKLSVDLGVDIPITKFSEDVTVINLAVFVNEQLTEKIPISPVSVINSVDDNSISEELLAQLNQLTAQEIDALLNSVSS